MAGLADGVAPERDVLRGEALGSRLLPAASPAVVAAHKGSAGRHCEQGPALAPVPNIVWPSRQGPGLVRAGTAPATLACCR
jgi:hypothetical protein